MVLRVAHETTPYKGDGGRSFWACFRPVLASTGGVEVERKIWGGNCILSGDNLYIVRHSRELEVKATDCP